MAGLRNPHRPKPKKPFNDMELRHWATPGTYGEGGGLYFQVKQARNKDGDPVWIESKKVEPVPKVTKAWLFRYRDKRTGKLQDMGLGSYKTTSLAKARDRAGKQRDLIFEGKDPIEFREATAKAAKVELEKKVTFADAARQFWNAHKGSWGPRHSSDWINSIEAHINPKIGGMVVSEIEMKHVLEIVQPMWGTETGGRVRTRIEKVWEFCRGKRWVTGDNPAKYLGNLDTQLPPLKKIRKKRPRPSLHYSEIAAFMADLQNMGGPASRALEFLILTATRTSETTEVTWREFDLGQRLWTIPEERMKMDREHFIPLSPRAMEILRAMGENHGPDDLVFPGGKPGEAGSNSYLRSVVDRMNENRVVAGLSEWVDRTDGRKIVVHGFRSTFRCWGGEKTNYAVDTLEHALAHKLKDKVQASYDRGTQIEKRTPLMNDWAKYCGTVSTQTDRAAEMEGIMRNMIPAQRKNEESKAKL